MSHLFKHITTRYIDANGKRCPKGTPGAKQVNRKSAKWYGRFRLPSGVNKVVPLYTDKGSSQEELAKLVRLAEQIDSGVAKPSDRYRKQPLADHVTAFREHLESKGDSGKHVDQTISRCEAVFSGCGFKLLGQLDADKVASWLKLTRDEDTFGIASSNHHLVAVKSFGNWLIRSRRSEYNPFVHLSKLNEKLDVRVKRRAMESGELSRLVAASEQSVRTFRGLTGQDRSVLYTVASMTGLRASELASLTRSSFDFQAVPPTVRIDAKNEKSGRGARLPVHPFAVQKLTHWLTSRDGDITKKLWPGTWSVKAAEMIRRDLDEARSIWLAEAEKFTPEHDRRTESRFLTPENADGEIADFHALRHTFVTMLVDSGVHPKTAQGLARHSTITLTMDRYAHANQASMNRAVTDLPNLGRLDGQPALNLPSPELSGCTPGCFSGDDSSGFLMTPDEVAGSLSGSENEGIPLETSDFQGDSSKGSGRSRTDDDGFAIRCNLDEKGLNRSVSVKSPGSGCTPGCHDSPKAVPVAKLADAELSRLIELWPSLPRPLRGELLRLAESSRHNAGQPADSTVPVRRKVAKHPTKGERLETTSR